MSVIRRWKEPQAYDFCAALTSAQWAWEFLRRNPEYQQQWQAFMETWQALEADYGKPPNRDFCAWKNDPRAWRPASECAQGECRVDEDKVLIECALGARWGFHKFPPDPADDDPVGAGRLSWRPRELRPLPEGDCDADTGMSLCFDLSLPLKPQLEQARRQLQMEAGLRRRQGRLTRRRVKTLAPHWTWLLRLLDARAQGAQQQAEHEWGMVEVEQGLQEADALCASGYLDLLDIPA